MKHKGMESSNIHNIFLMTTQKVRTHDDLDLKFDMGLGGTWDNADRNGCRYSYE